MTDLMKRKHQLRLIELEESVLFAQVNIDSFCFYLKSEVEREFHEIPISILRQMIMII